MVAYILSMTMAQKALIAVIVFLVLVVGYLFINGNKAAAPTQQETQTAGTDQTPPQSVTGTYVGDLPCADCEAIEQTLTINTDGTYRSETVYKGKSVDPFVETGKWESKQGDAKDPNATVIVLNPGMETVQYYLVVSVTEIKQLSPDLTEIDSPFNQTLTRQVSQ